MSYCVDTNCHSPESDVAHGICTVVLSPPQPTHLVESMMDNLMYSTS
jgi:hypothetical protein